MPSLECIHACLHVGVYARGCVPVYACMYVCMSEYPRARMYTFMHSHTDPHACMCVCPHMFTCKHVCMYACMHAHSPHAHTNTHACHYHIHTKSDAPAHTNIHKHTCNPTRTHTTCMNIRLHQTSREYWVGTANSSCSCQSWVKWPALLMCLSLTELQEGTSCSSGTPDTACH